MQRKKVVVFEMINEDTKRDALSDMATARRSEKAEDCVQMFSGMVPWDKLSGHRAVAD